MATTSSRITDDASYAPFYYLKITGFPYYFFATVNPTSSVYGSDAWTLPTGYTAIQGLRLPNDSLRQDLKDIVGGIATPERIRLVLQDFDTTDSTANTYKFFGRLFAPGRAISVTTEKIGMLDADLSAATGDAGTFTARGPDTFAPGGATSYVYVGGETIQYDSRSTSANVTTFTIGTGGRNKFPCHASYPPTPYYRVYKSETGSGSAIPTKHTPVTSQPLMIVGRTACLYIGHLRPNGMPETEANAVARVLGRIQSINYNAGLFTLELESVLGDLTDALAAPNLARAQFKDCINIPTTEWARFILGVRKIDVFDGTMKPTEVEIAISTATFTGPEAIYDLCGKINTAISALPTTAKNARLRLVKCMPLMFDGGVHVFFRAHRFADADNNYEWYVNHSMETTVGAGVPLTGSLLLALGFPFVGGPFVFTTPDAYGLVGDAASDVKWRYVMAPASVPSAFVPTSTAGTSQINLIGDDTPGNRFFLDQGDGSGTAWVRFGNGHIQRVTVKSASTLSVTSPNPTWLYGEKHLNIAAVGGPRFYYVPMPATGTVEQVICSPEMTLPSLGGNDLALCARLLCSNWDNTTDGEYDVFPEGVGLGLNALVDKSTFRVDVPTITNRFLVVDSTTKWADVFNPIAREYHYFLVWFPEDGNLAVRKLRLPTSAGASTFQFNESNRRNPKETTATDWDFTHMRTGWLLKYGWSWIERKFLRELGFTDEWAVNAYQVNAKNETIEDRSLGFGIDGAKGILTQLATDSVYFRYPWSRYTRGLNKTGLTLAPGTIHKIIDATVHNPFSGVFGITSGDNIYGYLTSVNANPATGDVEVEYIVPAVDKSNLRPWSPCALVDFDAAGAGWNAGTKTLTFKRHYTANSDATTYDGIDFAAGDKIRLITRDNDGAPYQMNDDTIVSVAATGLTVVLTTGFASLNASFETVMTVQPYTSCVAAQQSAYSFQGDGSIGLIQATARIHRFQ